MGSPASAIDRFTYRDYRGWEEGRWELINGEVFDMSLAPSRAHQSMLVALTMQLALCFEQHPCDLYVAPLDVRLPEGSESDDDVATVVQPDLVVICDKDKLDDRGCRGAPDWIIEILSPGTAAHDQVDKLRLYERHQIRSYWLVHPTELVVTMYRLGETGSYVWPDVRKLQGATAVPLFDGLEIDWDRAVASMG